MISPKTVATMCTIFDLCSISAGRRVDVSRALRLPAGFVARPSNSNADHFVSLQPQVTSMPVSTKASLVEDSLSFFVARSYSSSLMRSRRSADDYEDIFFVPTVPKPSSQNYMPSDKRDDDERVDGVCDDSESSESEKNFFDDDFEYDREVFRASAQAKISPSEVKPTQSEAQNQQQRPPRFQNSSAPNRNTRQQEQQQPNTGMLSTRALYQFRPIQSGSKRQMPPTDSSYDSYDIGAENKDTSSSQYYEDIIDQDVVTQAASDHDPFELGKIRRSAKINPRKDSFEVKNKQSPAQLPTPKAGGKAEMEEPQQISFNARSNDLPTARASRKYTPDFMKPTRVKAIITNSSESVINAPRKIPVEASTGNVSTSYIDTIYHQLEHLQAQIYQLNDGVKFNIGSPKQVAKVLFGEEDDGSSTNKDVLEALASAGNKMAEHIHKWRKLTSQYKKELKRIEQIEKGDRKNDYYGNLARRDSSNAMDTKEDEIDQVGIPIAIPKIDGASAAAMDKIANRETLLLIDASAYIFRSYHAMPPLHRNDGTPTGALHGVCRMLQSLLLSQLLKGEQPRVVLCFDSKGNNFRHELYPEYKANRGPCPEDLIPQFDLVKEAASAFGVMQIEADGYEADDVIATLSRLALDGGINVDIMSGDKDLWQLVTAPNVFPRLHMIDPLHLDSISHDDVIEKWGVSSDKLGDLLALAGDSSDNIKGAPGIGPKIAAQLINEYGSLSELLANTDKIKQNKRRESLEENSENIMLFRQLVALDDSIPVEVMSSSPSMKDVNSIRMSSFDPSKLISFYDRMELKTCKNELERRLRSSLISYKMPPNPSEYSNVPF